MKTDALRLVIKFINLIALLSAVAWFARSPDWEILVTSLTLLATLVGLEITEVVKRRQTEPDRRLFQSFLEVLPSNGSIAFLREHPMELKFDPERLNDLYEFVHGWADSEHEFHDRRLEKKRKELLELICQFLSYSENNTFPERMGVRVGVPSNWQVEQPARFDQVVRELYDRADKVVESHQDFVRTARRRLNL